MRISQEFLVGQAYTADKEGIDPDCREGLKTSTGKFADHIILVHPVTADAQSTNQGRRIRLVKWAGPGEKDNSILILNRKDSVRCVKVPFRDET